MKKYEPAYMELTLHWKNRAQLAAKLVEAGIWFLHNPDDKKIIVAEKDVKMVNTLCELLNLKPH